MFDASFPYGGVQRYWIIELSERARDDVLEILVDRSATMRSPMSMVAFSTSTARLPEWIRTRLPSGLRDDQWDYDVILAVERSRRVRRPHPVDAGVLDGGGTLCGAATCM